MKELLLRLLLAYLYRKIGDRLVSTRVGVLSVSRAPDWELQPFDFRVSWPDSEKVDSSGDSRRMS